jgi:competence protein ComEC
MQIPLVRTALALVAGILLGSLFLILPWTAVVLAFVMLAAAVLGCFRARRRAPALLGAAAAFAAGAALLLSSVLSRPEDHYLRLGLPDGKGHTVVGRVVTPLERDPDRTAFLLEAESADGRRLSGVLRVSVRGTDPGAGYGDRVSVTGRLHPPRGHRNPGGFDYPGHLARRKVFGVLQARSPADVRVVVPGRGMLRAIQDRRERIRQAFLASTSGDGSAVLQAMVLGEEGGLTDSLRERFMAAGVTHILSISGSHLGLVALLCFWLVRRALFLLPERQYHRLTLLVDPRKAAALGTAVPVTLYAFLAGGQVATLRSLVMILAGLAAVAADRPRSLAAALALAALLILVPAPETVFDISFQLSFLSVLSIFFVIDIADALAPSPKDRRLRRAWNVLMLLAVSVAATVATGPLVAAHFGQVAPAGIVANLIVVPFAGAVVVPLGLLSGVLSLLLGPLPFAGLNQLVADSFVAVVSFFAAIPGAVLRVPSPGPLFLAGYILVAVTAFRWVRAALFARFRPLEHGTARPRFVLPSLAAGCALMGLSVLLTFFPPRGAQVTFLDVGQGDCAFIESQDGTRVLIDGGGTRDGGFDTGSRIVVPWLTDRGVRSIDLVILSHPHPDHLNGLIPVLRAFRVSELWTTGLDAGLEGYGELLTVAAERKVPHRTVDAGERRERGGLRLEALHPDRTVPSRRNGRAYASENDRSLVVRVRCGGRSFLFPGDLHRDGERELLARSPDLAADVLKVPHHGSRSSTGPALLNAVAPRVAVVSAGAGNPYHHPSKEVLARFAERGIEVARTDRDGAVIVRPSARGISVLRWADLVLERMDGAGGRSWTELERSNWERLRIRTWGI